MVNNLKNILKKIKCKCNMLCCCKSNCAINDDTEQLNNIAK